LYHHDTIAVFLERLPRPEEQAAWESLCRSPRSLEAWPMPSAALLKWQNERLPSLAHVDTQCAASVAAVPANPALIDENHRGYVLLLAAHFQGFCRDLHTECAQIIASKVRPSLEILFQSQFSARRELDRGNANAKSIIEDFSRFGFNMKTQLNGIAGAVAPKANLHTLDEWRNAAAHHNTSLPPGGPLTVLLIRGWRNSCNLLATAFDNILYTQLRARLRRQPWPP
jgi:hypothetical protein